MKTFLQTRPVFLYLLSVFFVLHGYTENYALVPVKNALQLIAIYLGFSLIISFIFWLLFRNFSKAGLMAFIVMAYNFFFGSILYLLKNNFPGTFIYRYSFILPLSLILATVVMLLIKRRKKPMLQVSLYLNSLLLLLIIIEAGLLSNKIINKAGSSLISTNEFINCDHCSTPDIYLIIADEYAGTTELKDLFQFDNSKFETDLNNRGFHIVHKSASNYNFTPFSVASLLNLNYLENLEGSNTSSHDMSICYNTIKKNKTFRFFQQLGYKIYNCSIFDFRDDPMITASTFLPGKTKPIIAQTFIYRIYRDLGYHLATDLHLKFAINNIIYKELNNNNNVFGLTKKIALKSETQPKFVYTHLVMPHYPYFFDSTGNPTPIKNLNESYWSNKKAYLEYLLYTNKKLLELVDHIKGASASPPIIILIGDHGFRQFKENVDPKYYFLNLNSVFIPGSDYSGFYESISNINLFRVILNSQFGQHLPILKDSVSFLRQ